LTPIKSVTYTLRSVLQFCEQGAVDNHLRIGKLKTSVTVGMSIQRTPSNVQARVQPLSVT
jgi:hypothetical protein